MARKIVITSGKGGVGKTTIATNLSMQLARTGHKVILCDADFGLNNVDVAAGIEELIVYDIVDVIEGRCRAKQALVRHPSCGNLHLLTSSHSAPERYVSSQALKVVLEGLSPQYDFIIIDCPSGVDEGFHRAVCSADEALVVTTPQISALRDADKALTLLKSYKLDELFVVLNMARGDLLIAGETLNVEQISELLKTRIVGVIPDDYKIFNGGLEEHAAFKLLANNLVTGEKKLYDPTWKYAGFFGNVRRALKKWL